MLFGMAEQRNFVCGMPGIVVNGEGSGRPSCGLRRSSQAGPAFTRRAVGSECNLIVLDACDVCDNAFAVACPDIDAEGKVSSQCGHLPFTPSAPRFRAGASSDVPEV
jgi:hypothetical protein